MARGAGGSLYPKERIEAIAQSFSAAASERRANSDHCCAPGDESKFSMICSRFGLHGQSLQASIRLCHLAIISDFYKATAKATAHSSTDHNHLTRRSTAAMVAASGRELLAPRPPTRKAGDRARLRNGLTDRAAPQCPQAIAPRA